MASQHRCQQRVVPQAGSRPLEHTGVLQRRARPPRTEDFDVKPSEPAGPAVLESSRRSASIALFIGMVLLAPSIPLFIAGLGEGLSDGMTSATLEIKDSDEQGDLGWGIYVEGGAFDFNSNGIYDHCENIVVNATHTEVGCRPVDGVSKRQRLQMKPAKCSSNLLADIRMALEQRHHEGRMLIKIGRACYGCMAGTTTITAQNSNGGEVMMWIQDEEKRKFLGCSFLAPYSWVSADLRSSWPWRRS